jgi:neutral ceramidase
VFPYEACIDVGLMTALMKAFFDLTDEDLPLPLPESFKAGTTATRFGPLPTRMPDGTEQSLDVFGGFFPGEPTAMFVEQWRRRVRDELGHPQAWLVGYAQDHEGYLLIPEDWLVGGYEPNIAIWGPLQGEHIMEGVLEYGDAVLNTDVHEEVDPWGWHGPTEYVDRPLPTEAPDVTPLAGTRITADPPAYVWVPPGFTLDLDAPDTVTRVRDQVQLLWHGGDPAVDFPRISLERQNGDAWEAVTTRSGRPVTDKFADILLGHTPDPLYPASATQTHVWWATWQAVGHDGYRAGLPAGTYRLVVDGTTYSGGATTWPWPSEPYRIEGDPFEVVPTNLAYEITSEGVWLWVDGPTDGYRMIDVDGRSRGRNPVRGAITFEFTRTGGGTGSETVQPTRIEGGRTLYVLGLDAVETATFTDVAGNAALYPLPI